MPEQEQEEQKKKTIDGHFSQEFYMGRDELATFLRRLADEVEKDEEIKITTDEWELPFTPRDKAEVEVELEKSELEIEIEFERAKGTGKNLSVE